VSDFIKELIAWMGFLNRGNNISCLDVAPQVFVFLRNRPPLFTESL